MVQFQTHVLMEHIVIHRYWSGAGEITSGFGNINIGTSTFTGNGSGLTNVDADTLDGVNSTYFYVVMNMSIQDYLLQA